MKECLAIIRINPAYTNDMVDDSARFIRAGLYQVKYEVPLIKVLGVDRRLGRNVTLLDRPLLISYGFLRMPKHFAKNPVRLSHIKSMSRFIRGYFYKTNLELEEAAIRADLKGEENFRPTLTKTITEEQLTLLYETSKRIGFKSLSSEIGLGDTIVLRGYPFDGISAQVLSKSSSKVQVELLDSHMIVWISHENVYYNQSLLEDPYEL